MGVNPAASRDNVIKNFLQGYELHLQNFLGSHFAKEGGVEGAVFRVWAPHATMVTLIGDFNEWKESACPMKKINGGIWEVFVPGIKQYDTYKYAVWTKEGQVVAKADPFAFHTETRPGNASKVYRLDGYKWGDAAWMNYRKKHLVYDSPLNIYEVHFGSWRRTGNDEFLSYRDAAPYLIDYVKKMGFTHVEFMPLTEHPLDASWGYQCTGYYAATSRFGTPHDLMYLIDELHKAGIGVIMDWVPAHFPRDGFGLYRFDGEPCFEYADPRKGEHKEWGTMVFDYGRNEVRSFLLSSALFWLEEYHVDGLRVDAVASMLYLDYNRQEGEWIANDRGGKENLEAVSFLQALNGAVFAAHDDVLMIAEESTAWPKVTHPVSDGGLGFNLKWNMGWMNDIQHYMKLDPYFRQFNHHDITFSFMYAFSENFVLPLSHDEVVHMKGSLLNKMPGENPLKYAGVRAFYTFMMTHPGKKLTMMGSEFGQWNEWHFEHSLDWHLLDQNDEDGEMHRRLQAYVREINDFYLTQSELWEQDFDWNGFTWLDPDDANGNTAAFMRRNKAGDVLLVVCNFSPNRRDGYRLGVPFAGKYKVLINSDEERFGGEGHGDTELLPSESIAFHSQEQSISVDLPAMSALILKCVKKNPVRKKTPAKETKPKSVKSAKAHIGVPIRVKPKSRETKPKKKTLKG